MQLLFLLINCTTMFVNIATRSQTASATDSLWTNIQKKLLSLKWILLMLNYSQSIHSKQVGILSEHAQNLVTTQNTHTNRLRIFPENLSVCFVNKI